MPLSRLRWPAAWRVVAATVIIVSTTACSASVSLASLTYPASPTVTEHFGLVERCGRRPGECEDAARDLLQQLLNRLGQPYAGDGFVNTDIGAAHPAQLFVLATSTQGITFIAEGADGEASEVLVDATPVAQGEDHPYVVLVTERGIERYGAEKELVEDLLEALYKPLD